MLPHVHLNGRLLPLADAHVSVLDHGLLYGDSCFEAIRIYDGHPAFWRAHLTRLAESARLLDLPDPGSGYWSAALAALIEANGLDRAMVRLTLTRGAAPPGLQPGAPPAPTRIALAVPPPEPPTASKVATARYHRIPAASLPSAAKSGNYLPNLLSRRGAQTAGCDEALFVDDRGCYLEGTVSNLFYVDGDGRLTTPPLTAGCLPGITRDVVLAAATRLDIALHEHSPTRAELLTASEAFLTGTGYEVTPIATLDGEPIACGAIAPQMAAAYREAIGRDRTEDPLTPPGGDGQSPPPPPDR